MRLALVAAVCLSIFGLAAAADAQAAMTKMPTNIPAQGLGPALKSLAKERGLQVVFRSEVVGSARTQGASGNLTTPEALTELLKGTDLSYLYLDENTVTIVPSAPAATSAAAEQSQTTTQDQGGNGKKSFQDFHLAQVDQTNAGPQVVADDQSSEKRKKEKDEGLTEIVVTGTHIRGVAPAGSPVIVMDQAEIQHSGFASTRDLINSLPQNYGSGFSETTSISPNPQSQPNVGAISTVNLRGLGSESSLVLLDGRRLAPTGQVAAIDIGAIPLSAIERVEVLTDGASAIYGSDAVGGVVNFILKKDFEGADTLLQYGTDGHGLFEKRASQALGTQWSTGHFLATYEYYERDPLLSQERSFSSNAPPDTDLTADQSRNSLVLTGSQRIGDAVEAFFTGLATKQKKTVLNPIFDNETTDDQTAISASTGLIVSLPKSFNLDLTADYGHSLDEQNAVYSLTPVFVSNAKFHSDVASLGTKIDGPIATLWAGTVAAALGADVRHEKLNIGGSQLADGRRTVESVYGELGVPLLAPSETGVGQRLDLSIAGRFEHYSDFGRAETPKIGLSWLPIRGVTFRGTWGKSFRAPNLNDEYSPVGAYVTDLPDPQSPTGSTLTIAATGANPKLQPERATTWTAGADLKLDAFPNSSLAITYFDIAYRNRIQLVSTVITDYLVDEALWPVAVQRNPPLSAVNNLIAQAGTNLASAVGPFNPADIGAIIQGVPLNVASYLVNGIDVQLKSNFAAPIGQVSWDINSTYLFKTDEQVTPQAPVVNRLDKIFYSPALKLRGSAAWSVAPWSMSGFANFVKSYTNDTVTPEEPIASYLTFDGQLAFEPISLRGFRASLTVRNIFNRQPPFVTSPQYVGGTQFGFDPANADPIGRFMTLQAGFRW